MHRYPRVIFYSLANLVRPRLAPEDVQDPPPVEHSQRSVVNAVRDGPVVWLQCMGTLCGMRFNPQAQQVKNEGAKKRCLKRQEGCRRVVPCLVNENEVAMKSTKCIVLLSILMKNERLRLSIILCALLNVYCTWSTKDQIPLLQFNPEGETYAGLIVPSPPYHNRMDCARSKSPTVCGLDTFGNTHSLDGTSSSRKMVSALPNCVHLYRAIIT